MAPWQQFYQSPTLSLTVLSSLNIEAQASGSTVAAVFAGSDFVSLRPSLEAQWEDGTPPFLQLAAELPPGLALVSRLSFSAIQRLMGEGTQGGLEQVRARTGEDNHVSSLALFTTSRLLSLRHCNGQHVCIVYGRHRALLLHLQQSRVVDRERRASSDSIEKNGVVDLQGREEEREAVLKQQGGVVAFNLKRSDGSWVGHKEVEKLAAIHSIHLRTGCFCNPGACAKHLRLSHSQLLENYEAGHVCWDDNDVIAGRPTGAVIFPISPFLPSPTCNRPTGCFCNPGACAKHLRLSHAQLLENYEAGHVCWDDNDLIAGRPTGAVRISFGHLSTIDDVEAFLSFIQTCFVELPRLLHDREWLIINPIGTPLRPNRVTLAAVPSPFSLFPTSKSLSVSLIPLGTPLQPNRPPPSTVPTHPTTSQLSPPLHPPKCPRLSPSSTSFSTPPRPLPPYNQASSLYRLRPSIDLASCLLSIHLSSQDSPAQSPLQLPLDTWPDARLDGVRVCGDRYVAGCGWVWLGVAGCGWVWKGVDGVHVAVYPADVAAWLSAALGTPSNEAQLLVLSSTSLADLRKRVAHGIEGAEMAEDGRKTDGRTGVDEASQTAQFRLGSNRSGSSSSPGSHSVPLPCCPADWSLRLGNPAEPNGLGPGSEMGRGYPAPAAAASATSAGSSQAADVDRDAEADALWALRFRPNIVVGGADVAPYDEDRWKELVGQDASFESLAPCSRCAIINTDPATGQSSAPEPLRTLSGYRRHKANINFGVLFTSDAMALSLCAKTSLVSAAGLQQRGAAQERRQTGASLSASLAHSAAAPSFKAFDGMRANSTFSSASSFLSGAKVAAPVAAEAPAAAAAEKGFTLTIVAGRNSKKIQGRKLRVAVIGGGPAGGCAAETLAENGIETFLIERKLDNAKPCGGAIPLCMVDEFQLPQEIIDRRVTKMKMISPSNVEVDVGRTLGKEEYIGMVRREVLDAFLRNRAQSYGATVINGLYLRMDVPKDDDSPYVIHYSDYAGDSKVGVPKTLEVDAVIGADGANSRVAKDIDAGDYDYAIAFQERIRLPEDKMAYYEDLAEMYVGDDVSPDFYGWVFPKCDHVAVGTGTVINKPAIKQYQTATRNRAKDKIEGGKIIRVEAHPIPEHPRPRRTSNRVALVGDAAGYVTKCSGEGIYFAAKSGRMAAEAIAEGSEKGTRMIDESDLRVYLDKWDKKYWATYKEQLGRLSGYVWMRCSCMVDESDLRVYLDKWDKKYRATYKVLDILQKVFYRSNPAREAFVEMCADDYVQKMTFDSYLYKTVVPGNPLDDLKLAVNTIGSLIRANALRKVALEKA
ncbi:unnamed protein product [Closterium sp. NIES-64]|nr:unnamed protein product [Closterium sp. NIES-64]